MDYILARNLAKVDELYKSGHLIRVDTANSLVQLVHSVARILQGKKEQRTVQNDIENMVGSSYQHYVFLLADGLGKHLLCDKEDGHFLKSHLKKTLTVRIIVIANLVDSVSINHSSCSHKFKYWNLSCRTWITRMVYVSEYFTSLMIRIYLPDANIISEILPFIEKGTTKQLSLPTDQVYPCQTYILLIFNINKEDMDIISMQNFCLSS